MKEYILCAAIWFDDGILYNHQPKNIESGYVICGHRHHNCFMTANILQLTHEYSKIEKEQGFITNINRFVDRKEALKIAIDANQLKVDNQCNYKQLFSEDLY